MRVAHAPSFPVSIFIAGDHDAALEACRAYCDRVGLCVTVTPTTYAYTDGQEAGVIVGLINYPRFPKMLDEIEAQAVDLGHHLREALGQESFSVQTPARTTWISFRPADLAQGTEARRAETVKQGSVHESPVGASRCAQPQSSS